jgi:threonine/homoserine/homoserine lactone efflux protein
LLVIGDLISGIVAVVLVICALILAYDGWQAFQARKAEAAASASPSTGDEEPSSSPNLIFNR